MRFYLFYPKGSQTGFRVQVVKPGYEPLFEEARKQQNGSIVLLSHKEAREYICAANRVAGKAAKKLSEQSKYSTKIKFRRLKNGKKLQSDVAESLRARNEVAGERAHSFSFPEA